MLCELNAQGLSNVAHGMAKARVTSRDAWAASWAQMACAAVARVHEFKPQGLANT
eukprot:CAMPEP_0119367234 /NCGR_PEP_ID=MMETSP1334-20130426/14041_1 /TAXON_ID=127549 /ORGANISM="Calcidiscus leptoporus, Strain RCC1130" /LENGTH=54 /DNA_ID=CAMNT_0007383607 /DNA_START=15 /DNA_END=175 /DNA_ORIENTATION=+